MKPKSILLTSVCALAFALPSWSQTDVIPAGTNITVRTNESIDGRSSNDGRVFSGVVDQDVRDSNGNTAIPRGANAELMLRRAGSNEVVLDLDSISVNGRRYAVSSSSNATVSGDGTQKEGVGKNKRTGKYVGGGAVLGTIIGAIAGGGKGAAIGAAAGAAAGAGAQTMTRGRQVRVPAESLVTFRLDRDLRIAGPDTGYTRDGRHYHRNYQY